jgi:glucose/mannose-6-phosphate isomerase
MTVSLDDETYRAQIDLDGSYERIHGLPEQCEEAWAQSRDLVLPDVYQGLAKLLIIGMGGSATAADHLQALMQDESRTPVTVVRGYTLPRWVDGRTLIVACSHSGNTEEVLSAFDEALASPAKKVVITTGGRIAELAQAKGVPCITYEYPNVPRDAFGHGLLRLIAVAQTAGMFEVAPGRIEAAVEAMKKQREGIEASVPEAHNVAKNCARVFEDAIPYVVAGGFMAPVARRWRTQINENADVISFWDELPELDHNLVVGLNHPADILRSIRAIFLDHESLHPRTRLRYDLTSQIFDRAGITTGRHLSPQPDPLAAQLCAVHFGDLVSYYLAMLKGTRPVEIENINWLKDELASRPVG